VPGTQIDTLSGVASSAQARGAVADATGIGRMGKDTLPGCAMSRGQRRRGTALHGLLTVERENGLQRMLGDREEKEQMRVAIYGRVSTAEQSAAMQIEELRAYCLRRQWEVVEEFIDAGVSGSKESRPALNRLLADAKRRKFGAVLVYRYDRFARSLRQLVNALAEFDALGIHFVSLHEGVDTSTPNGRLVFGIFASIAEFERELIRGRVRSGLAAARARGQKLGRPRVIVDPATIASLRTEGLSWAKIGERLGVGEGTVYRTAQASAKNVPKTVSTSPIESMAD
jgi:DNA invertase Pin-like site-specific DNA recombinase